MSQAFRDALARDARVQAAQNRIAQAREGLEEVRSDGRPTLSVTGNTGYSYNRNEARTVSTYKGRSLRGNLQINQNLYTFGRLRGRLLRAEAEIGGAEHAAEEVRQEVLAEVARSFVQQLFQERIFERRRAFEALVDELGRVAHERIALGALDKTELHEILRRLHRVRAKRIEAGSHYRISRARLARLTGADREDLAAVSLAHLEAAIPVTLKDALARAEGESPALGVARQRLEAAQGELIFRDADLLPILSLEVSAGAGEVGDVDTFDVGGGLNLAVPLYEGGRKRSRLRNARLAVETVRRELTAERERIEVQVRSSWDLIESLILAQRDFEAAIADAQTVVELTRSKLDAGRATFVQHIETRQFALDAEFDRLDGRLSLEIARIDLLHTLADLGPPPTPGGN